MPKNVNRNSKRTNPLSSAPRSVGGTLSVAPTDVSPTPVPIVLLMRVRMSGLGLAWEFLVQSSGFGRWSSAADSLFGPVETEVTVRDVHLKAEPPRLP